MVGRLTASILYSANLSDYIAENLDDYVEISRKIYLKGIRNKEDKIQLKKLVNKSPLSDAKRVALSLENMYMNQFGKELNKISS